MLVIHINDFLKDLQTFQNLKAENIQHHLFIRIA